MNTPQRNESGIRRLLSQIDTEYQAAQLGLSGLAQGVSQHAFISKRMEGIGNARRELVELVGSEDEATCMVVDQLNRSWIEKPDKSSL